jgi:hypothetical protein
MTMDRIEPSIYTRQKKLKKLIKLIEGRNEVPSDQIKRVENQILQLGQEFNTFDINKLKKEYIEITNRAQSLNEQFNNTKGSRNHISNWYLRPLISHFDSTGKIDALRSDREGLGELQDNVNLFLPPGMLSQENNELHTNLNFYYQFKSRGKGKSTDLETNFYKSFNLTDRNPFAYTTLGKNQLPVFYYKVDEFNKKLDLGQDSVVVTGLCPISGISNEIKIIQKAGNGWQPELGFEPLPLPDQDFGTAELIFPPRPILSDYIAIKNFIEVRSHLTKANSVGEISGLIWYPHVEYIKDFIDIVFFNWLDSGLINRSQIIDGFNTLESRYKRLVEAMIKSEGFDGDIQLRVTRSKDLELFNRTLSNIDLSRIRNIYGIWAPPDSRKHLYKYLIIKHILSALNGLNTVHLENSYEIWPNIQGSRAVQDLEEASTYSWICYPSAPSLSMSYMRDYNAPYDDKLFLAEPEDEFVLKIQKLSKNYINYILPQLFDFEEIAKMDQDTLCTMLMEKLTNINKALSF